MLSPSDQLATIEIPHVCCFAAQHDDTSANSNADNVDDKQLELYDPNQGDLNTLPWVTRTPTFTDEPQDTYAATMKLTDSMDISSLESILQGMEQHFSVQLVMKVYISLLRDTVNLFDILMRQIDYILL